MTDYRDIAIEMVEDGMIGPMTMLTACLKYMSNDEVKDMLEINEFVPEAEDEAEEDDDMEWDWNNPASPHHY